MPDETVWDEDQPESESEKAVKGLIGPPDSKEGRTLDLNLSDGVTAESKMSMPPLRSEPLDLPPAKPYVEIEKSTIPAEVVTGSVSAEEELPPDPPLPREVTDVWGVSEESLSLAKSLIDAWGLNRFLNSELHTQAVKEKESSARLAPIRAAYVKAMKEKEKKK